LEALLTIFIVAIGDDWNQIMYSYYRGADSKGAACLSVVYFVVMYILMNVLLLNLFTAILLDSYSTKPSDEDAVRQEEEEEAEEDIGPVYICLHLIKYRMLVLL
jgi:hypothetical protein